MNVEASRIDRDIAGRVDIDSIDDLGASLGYMLSDSLSASDQACVVDCLTDLERLYAGQWPGYLACDVGFHDLAHVLDVTLAMGRLLDGYQQTHADTDKAFNADQLLAGLISAMFHDIGYLRRSEEADGSSGGKYTPIHVRRSAYFVIEYLPKKGLERLVPICRRIMHFTAYDINPQFLVVDSPQQRELGGLLGTADLMAQMADTAYLRKCRDGLYTEFEASGVAGSPDVVEDVSALRYESVAHLMRATPQFMRHAMNVRLENYFQGVYHYAERHFGGRNYYMDGIEANLQRLTQLIDSGDHWLDQL